MEMEHHRRLVRRLPKELQWLLVAEVHPSVEVRVQERLRLELLKLELLLALTWLLAPVLGLASLLGTILQR